MMDKPKQGEIEKAFREWLKNNYESLVDAEHYQPFNEQRMVFNAVAHSWKAACEWINSVRRDTKQDKINNEFLFMAKTIKHEVVIGHLSESLGYHSQPKQKGYYISNEAGSPWAYLVRPETIIYINKKEANETNRNEIRR